MRKEIETKLNWFWLIAEVQTEYEIEERVEEGHGYHSFIDSKEVRCDVLKASIKIKDIEIDITNRLTKEELKLLIQSLEIENDEL
jgi:hypothetical protein